MDRLDAMEMFVAAVDEGSLARAARRLGRSPASVTRAIALLEKLSGERLLHRSTRSLRLTEAGERRSALYRSVIAELAEAEGDRGPGRIEGTIGLTAPELFGRLKVMPVVEDFLVEHPGVRARILLLNRVVNLIEEGLDLAIRLAPLPDSGLVAVKLGEIGQMACAAPSYLEGAGRLDTPADLVDHVTIGQDDGRERGLWQFAGRSSSQERLGTVVVRHRLASNSAGAAIDSAVRGHGICLAMSYQVVEHLAAGRLVRVLSKFERPPVPVSLVFHPIPRRNAVLRSFVDNVTPRLRHELASISSRLPASR